MLTTLLLSAALATAEPAAWHRYDVRVDENLSTLDVRACFADGLPDRLVANSALATDVTVAFRYIVGGRVVTASPRSNAVLLRNPSDDGCIAWTSDLEAVADVNRINIGYRSGGSLVLDPGAWFWRPLQLTRTRDIEIRFHLPGDMRVSVPWQPLPAIETGVARFRHGHAPPGWSALMALGALRTNTFKVAGATFHLAVADGPAHVESGRVQRWLEPAALAAAQVWGEFPVDPVQLLVVPLDEGYDAAPWAQTNRGGGAGVHFFMNAQADDRMLRDDWIATHELAHFALPYVRRSDAWLSEGFASYYQHVLRARTGTLTPLQAWQELHEGFMRGHRNTEYDTLRDDSRFMHGRGRVMRVYWSGAAIALLADVELRRQSGGEWSLDRVLEEFNTCCRRPQRAWTARELFAQFDAITATDIFDTLYRRHVHSRHFPRLAETLAALGIGVNDGKVELSDDTPLRHIRSRIMAPRGTAEETVPAANAAGKSSD